MAERPSRSTDEWLRTSVEPRLRPRTTESYRATVRGYIAPGIGSIRLAKLEPEHVARMMAGVAARGVSPTTVRYSVTILRIALERAVRIGLVVRNVAKLVDTPSKSRPQMRPLTAAQIRTFLEATKSDRLGPLYRLALASGMRQGELLALRWEDVDLDSGTLAVRHTLRRGNRELGEPKTERSRRSLPLRPDVVAVLREHRIGQLEDRMAAGRRWHERGFVFTTRMGEPLHSRNVLYSFQTAIARAGLPHQRFHDLRHGAATVAIEAGVPLEVVSAMLGHSSISTTADVYAHITAPMFEDAADRIAAALAPVESAS